MKKVLKSVVAVVLCLAMVLSLAACGAALTSEPHEGTPVWLLQLDISVKADDPFPFWISGANFIPD